MWDLTLNEKKKEDLAIKGDFGIRQHLLIFFISLGSAENQENIC